MMAVSELDVALGLKKQLSDSLRQRWLLGGERKRSTVYGLIARHGMFGCWRED